MEKRTKREGWTIETLFDLFPDLKRLDRHMGGKRSGGQQQMLTIARTLMGNPSLLLLDEPVEGLAPIVVKALAETLVKLKKERKLTILLSEQNVKFAAALSDTAYVIEKGVIRYHGPMQELSENMELKRQYLAV